jgi:amino acid adenylation domain-containing protein/non-ribosomal peptide synthase protein (TIGR01720 family)
MRLLPSQREFLATDARSYDHNSQSVLLTAPAGLDLPLVIGALYHRHDALRLRFAFVDGIWEAVEAPLTAGMIAESCVLETLPEDPKLQSNFIRERCAHYLRSLDITHGPLFRAVYLQGHAEKQGRLLLVIHRLLIDDASWRVLLRDLDAAHRQVSSGGPTQRATKNSSYQQWEEALTDYAMSDALQSELDYWLDNSTNKVAPWPVPPLSKEAAPYASTRNVPVQLSVAETTALLRDCTATHHSNINELLLCAVYLAMRDWSGQTGVRITLEEHCRDLFPEIDVTGTVGCFTTRYPLVLHSEAQDLSTIIKSVKEQYRAVPHHGIGYGLLCDEMLIDAAATDPPILLFRYQGDLNQVMHSVDPHLLREDALCLSGSVAGGSLRFKLEYSEKQYSKETMVALAGCLENALQTLIAHQDAGCYIPSDFRLATVDQTTLDEWQTTYAIDQLYPATAMQKGMIFHSLLDPSAYVTQLYSTIEGDLQLRLLQQAWETVIERHAMLRTVFVGEGEEQHQLVIKRVSLPWYEEDLRRMTAEEQGVRFEEYRQADRAQGFALTQAPLMRLSLFRINDDQYRLLWSHHHSMLDGWSIRLVFTEVMQVYAALSASLDPVLPPVAEYARYVDWLLAQDTEKARQYWQTYLADIETVTRLPYDTQARRQEPIHEMQEVSLSAGDLAQLRELAKRHHTTVNTLLQLAWGVVLQSYAGEKQVVFGTVISGRMAEVAEVERMVGLTINSIPVVVNLDGNESLSEAIRHLHSTFQQSQKYSYLPLTEIQNQSRLSRGTPLFESLLVFENYTLELTNAAANGAGPVRMGEFGANLQDTYPLVVSMFQRESLQVLCKYFGDQFSAATIGRMLEQFIRVLEQLPNCHAVTDIRLLSKAERQQLLEWNDTSAEYSRETCIHELFEQQVEWTPASTAVIFGSEELSYRELNARANQLAHYLCERGVSAGELVGLCAERSLEMVVGMLGVLKAGSGYVPIDPEYPRERVSQMLRDSGIKLLLTQQQLEGQLPEHGAQVVRLDGDWDEIAQCPDTNLPHVATAENLAYMIYTSGSTGQPKGVMVPHRALGNHMAWMQRRFPLTAADRVIQKTPFSFDASVWELFAPLLVGARLVMADPGGHQDLAYLVRFLKEQQITALKIVPSLLEALLEESGIEECVSLRYVFCGAEAMPVKLAEKFYQRLGGAELFNLYGPTETAIDVTYWECKTGTKRRSIPIGRPIMNTQVYVLDDGMQVAPPGVVGELYVGGESLAHGYWQLADLTAERFVPNPYSPSPGKRLYRTGDLVRWNEAGELEYLGRNDQQVKVRGFRIELGEIETVLRRRAGVREAVAVLREGKLLAYVVGEETVSELQHYLKDKLPKYMVPQLIVLEQLPLTASGKVDRQALPAPEQAGAEAEADYVAPRIAEEELLAGIWAEVLGVERISVHDNFFERGGHSLLGTQVISRIRAVFQVDLPLRALFDTATLAELAQLIVTERRREAVGTGPAIVRRSRETAPVLSYAQQRLWFLDQLEPQSTIYNVPASLLLTGELDRAALAQSLNEIARRHEVLRTSFPSGRGQPVQHIAPAAPIDLKFIDLEALTKQDREVLEGRYYSTDQKVKQEFTFSKFLNYGHCEDASARQLASEEAARPFDLAHGPVWRVALLRLAEQQHLLLVTMHHIVTDGWSVGVLLRELTTVYKAYSHHEESPLAELPIQYADYAEWQREWLQGAVLEEQMDYWREQLAGSTGVLELPTDHARPPVQRYRGANLTVQLSEELTRGLRELSQREGVTLFMTLLSGWQTLLARYSGQWDLNVGTPIANRTRSELEGLIGYFGNTLVLRARMKATASFREQLKHVREVCLGAYAHQDVPFEMVVEELQPERDMSRSPLLQVMFVLQNAPLGEFETPAGLKLEALAVDLETTKFDLTLTVMEADERLVAWCNYRTDLFVETTIARMLEHWQVLLAAAVADPEQSLSTLPLWQSEAERQQFQEWKNTTIASNGHIGPRNLVDELIAEVWSDVLGIKVVSIHSDFFGAGGNSLLATRVIERLGEIFHVDIDLHSLFEQPTIAGLSDNISTALNDGLFIQAEAMSQASH